MISEWLKVMLDEIARKKAEQEQARNEENLRRNARRAGEDSSARCGGDV